MSLPTEGKLLRIFVGEADHWHGKPLYEAIVLEARKRGLAGATVVKGFMGFGAHALQPSLLALLGLVIVFALGILLSMSLFGIVLAGTLGTPRVAAWAGQGAAVVTAVASVALGAYWVFWRI